MADSEKDQSMEAMIRGMTSAAGMPFMMGGMMGGGAMALASAATGTSMLNNYEANKPPYLNLKNTPMPDEQPAGPRMVASADPVNRQAPPTNEQAFNPSPKHNFNMKPTGMG